MDYWNFVEYLCTRSTLHTRTVLEQIKLGKQLPTLAQNKGLVRNEQGGERWKQKEGHSFLRLRKGRGHKKWAVKRGRVMQIYGRDHIEVHPQKKKEVLYLVKQRGRNRRVEWSAVRIRVGLLMLSSKMYVYSITKNRLEIYFEFS